MKFYDVSFMDVGPDVRLNVSTREGSTWVRIHTPEMATGVVLHFREGHEDRLRAACEAFNAALAEPVLSIAAE